MNILAKTQQINNLLDRYEPLLTDRQRDVMNLYYREDLSYQEIANDLDISKSAIYDIIKRVSQNLNDYEEKLGLVKENKRLTKLFNDLKAYDNEFVNRLIQTYEEETHG